VVALTKRANTRVLSAWDAGTASAGLRPKPTAAMLVVSVDRPEKDVVKYDQPQIEKLVSRQISAPVTASISGQPSIDQAIKNESVSVVKAAAVIAVGVLFVILLIGLRAPLGAALVTIVAGTTTMSAFGVMALLGKGMDVDALALATGAIAGLARAASYSLTMLDRFHHEQDAHPDRTAESLLADVVGTTGRALLYAGTAMIAALLLTDALGPTDLLATLGIGAVLCTALATGAAVVVVPAGLALFGDAVNWRLPAPAFLSGIWDRMVAAGEPITRHPLATGGLAAAALLALAVPGLAAKSGPQDVRQLPPDNQARVAFTTISRVMGPGYANPYDVIVANPNGPITTTTMLSKLNRFETRIANDPAVVGVVGPGATFGPSAADLKKFGPSLAKSAKISNQSKRDLLKLIDGLGQAGSGSAQLRSGLAKASSGANRLHSGSGKAQSGAGLLHSGLESAKSGSAQLTAGLNKALSGARALKTGAGQVLSGAQQLRTGAGQALAGSSQLTNGLGQAAAPVKAGLPAVKQLAEASAATNGAITRLSGTAASAHSEAANALAALGAMTSGKSDPKYAAAVNAITQADAKTSTVASGLAGATRNAATAALLAGGVNSQINQLSPGLERLLAGSSELQGGIAQLQNGNAALAQGIGQLANGSGQLSSGMGQLTGGGSQLTTVSAS
jgi:X-X-X-Leu-X-X-Gly heptad repeat protein